MMVRTVVGEACRQAEHAISTGGVDFVKPASELGFEFAISPLLDGGIPWGHAR